MLKAKRRTEPAFTPVSGRDLLEVWKVLYRDELSMTGVYWLDIEECNHQTVTVNFVRCNLVRPDFAEQTTAHCAPDLISIGSLRSRVGSSVHRPFRPDIEPQGFKTGWAHSVGTRQIGLGRGVPSRVTDERFQARPARQRGSGRYEPMPSAVCDPADRDGSGAARPANPIESTFATVRNRSTMTKGPGSRAAGIAMAYKLIEAARAHRRALNAPHLVALVRAGAKFENGHHVARPAEVAA
jgi:hypothetical protein